MHTTASSLVAIAQYFWRIRTSHIWQSTKISHWSCKRLSAASIRDSIWIRIVAADSIRDSIRTEISDSHGLYFPGLTFRRCSTIMFDQ